MRLLVLEGARLAVPDAAIVSVESGMAPTTPWLADLLCGVTSTPTQPLDRRTLRLRGGGAVNVPAAMHIVEDVEVLELSSLLRHLDAGGAVIGALGVIGIAQLRDGLSVVCDPRELVDLATPEPSRP